MLEFQFETLKLSRLPGKLNVFLFAVPVLSHNLATGTKVAVGMYMMVMQNAVKFFGDTVFNIDPDAESDIDTRAGSRYRDR